MAVTNHLKKKNLLPTWARRGRLRLAHVPGGPSEMAARILNGRWPGGSGIRPGELLLAGRYGPALVEELRAHQFNAVCLTWSVGFSDEGDEAQWRVVRELLPLLKKARIKVVASISLTFCYAEEMQRHCPQAPEWQQRDPFGNVLTWRGETKSGPFRGPLLMDTRQAGWREYLKRKALSALEAGVDGFFFEGFSMCGGENDAEALNELLALVRAARPDTAGEFLFYHEAVETWPLNEIGNAKFCGYLDMPGFTRKGSLNNNLARLKFAFEDSGRDKPLLAAQGFGDFRSVVPTPEEARASALAAGEILATGGSCCELDMPAAYLGFQAEYKRFYEHGDPINTIGVLCAHGSLAEAGPGDCEQVVTLLARRNIQFDIIPVRNHERHNLRKYKAIYAGHAAFLPEHLIESLVSYHTLAGGTVIATPVTGSFEGQPGSLRQGRRPFALDGPPGRRIKETGDGRIIEYAPAREIVPGDSFALGEFEAALVEDLRAFGGALPIDVQAPDGVMALLWGKGTDRWVHVLNYRDVPSDVTITLPGCGGRKLAVYSPDAAVPALNVMETGQAAVRFTLAGLQTYAVVEVV